MKTKLVYWDHNLYVKVPKEYLKQLGWEQGDCLNIDLDFAFSKLEIYKTEEDEQEVLDVEADEDDD